MENSGIRLDCAIQLAQGRLSGRGVASASCDTICESLRCLRKWWAADIGLCHSETPSIHVQHGLSHEAAIQQLPGHGTNFAPACLDLDPWLEHATCDHPGKDCQPF